MDYEYQDKKIGGGIITISILHFLGLAVSLLGTAIIIPNKDKLAEYGTNVSNTTLAIEIIISIIICTGAVLILRKLKLGIIIYYIGILATLINVIISSGFNILNIIVKLILPVLMAIFINKKKELFGFGNS